MPLSWSKKSSKLPSLAWKQRGKNWISYPSLDLEPAFLPKMPPKRLWFLAADSQSIWIAGMIKENKGGAISIYILASTYPYTPQEREREKTWYAWKPERDDVTRLKGEGWSEQEIYHRYHLNQSWNLWITRYWFHSIIHRLTGCF